MMARNLIRKFHKPTQQKISKKASCIQDKEERMKRRFKLGTKRILQNKTESGNLHRKALMISL